MIAAYYRLAKPGIVYGNTLTTLAAFLYASHWRFSVWGLAGTIVGVALVIAGACVFNNLVDRDLDAKMERTSGRPLVTGAVSIRGAAIYGAALTILGLIALAVLANVLTALVALAGSLWYVVVYGYAKRVSHWGTLVGSAAGAMPIVVGYTAVSDRLDAVALILFLTLAAWQMPHFYAIATRRIDEYHAAEIPVLPISRGIPAARLQSIIFICLYAIAAASLTFSGHAGYVYLVVAAASGIAWLAATTRGYERMSASDWAKRSFRTSLFVLLAYSLVLAFGTILP